MAIHAIQEILNMIKIERCFLLLVGVILVSGCISTDSSVEVVEEGDYVRVDYTGKLEDGTVFDTSIKEVAIEAGIYNQKRDYQPLGFTVGAGEMIKGLDKGITPVLGAKIRTLQGQVGTITNVTDTDVVIDFNHELAGKTLIFDVKLVSIGKDNT